MGQSPACPGVSPATRGWLGWRRAVPRLPGREQQGPRSEAGLDSGAGSWCPIRPGTVPGRGRPAPPPRARRRPRGPPLAWGAAGPPSTPTSTTPRAPARVGRGRARRRVSTDTRQSTFPAVQKRWPARISHPPPRTPPIPKWRNDAIPCARGSRRAPGSHAPATFLSPADAPGPRRRGCRRLRPYSGRHRPRPDRGRGGRWPGSPREPPRRVVYYASSRLLRSFALRCTRKRDVAEGGRAK